MPAWIRIQKYCADCGLCSRRSAEEKIEAGEILVNGSPAQIGQKIDPDRDVVEYCGRRIRPPQGPKHYVMLNKPRGIVCTANDEKGRTNVTDLVRIDGARLYPVGRLDMDSDGLILLTDDGEFANQLTHPSHEIPKIYHVTFREPPTEEQLASLQSPIRLDGYLLRPVKVRILSDIRVEITLWEGRNRQIRRMCDQVGLNVLRLRRVAIGKLRLGKLPFGTWRDLTEDELRYLRSGGKKHSESEKS